MVRRTIGGLLLATLCLMAESGGGISWTVPSGWKAEAARPMRLATYSLGTGAECGVYNFGAGQGGTVQANIDRWIGQFQQADGKPSKAVASVGKHRIHGMPVTTLEISGSYTGMEGPGTQSAAAPGYRLVAAIVEGPKGSVFFKCAGPEKIISTNQAAFYRMLASIGPAK
jgi:hypothetical protein